MDDWADYLELVDHKDSARYFTNKMKRNDYYNFTNYILADMKAFLTTLSGIVLFKLFPKAKTNDIKQFYLVLE